MTGEDRANGGRAMRVSDKDPATLTSGDLRRLLEGADSAAEAADSAASAFSDASSAAADASAILIEVRELRDELEELGRAHDTFVGWVFEVYDWFQAGMPDEGAKLLRVEGLLTRRVQRVDEFARAYNERREPDGTGPTQEALGEALHLDPRTLRNYSWARIVARADELQAEASE